MGVVGELIDDVHFLDMNRRDGREVANHFKWLSKQFPVTFVFVGVALRPRHLLDEGLTQVTDSSPRLLGVGPGSLSPLRDRNRRGTA
ncbi:MAG: hypothetical protein LC749_17730 [Actinobacteria bacterium]|nr:hypothetical protein [Actinomycetota bacterium]